MKDTEQIPMPEIESEVFECASIDEAKEKGAEKWGIKPEDVDATVLSEDKKLFGLLGSTYRVEVKPFAPVSYIRSCHFVNEILDKMDLDLIPELTDDGIINLVCHDDMSTRRVRFDCGGYRERREQTLRRLAESIAREAKRKGSPVSLEPMTSWERRLIHITLRDNRDVETRSIGEEPMRRVLVCPLGGASRERGRRRPPRGKFSNR